MQPGHTGGGQEDNRRPEPLTHRNSAGEVYQRDPAVEEQIRQVRHLAPDALRERAGGRDRASPDYHQEECLVYLIRHYHRAGDSLLVSDLAEILLRRCATLIDRRLRSLGAEAAEEGYNDVVERLFGLILDLSSDRGDFLQVRFWRALEKLAVRAFHQQLRQHQRAQVNVSLSSLIGHDQHEGDESARMARPDGEAPITAPSGEADIIRNDLIRDALSHLDEPLRSAFLLRYHAGWPIEDQDPTVRTISRHFGKGPRTIRNWLKRAETSLQTWQGQQL